MMYQPDQSLRIGGTYFPRNNYSRKGNVVTHVRYYDPAYIYIYIVSAREYTAETHKAPQSKYYNLAHNLKIY